MQLPAASSFVAARAEIHHQVTASLAESRRRMEGVANPKRRAAAHAVGDRVWLSSQHLPIRSGARKLSSRWAGPFAVLERIGQAAYRLELPGSWQVHPVFHVSQLKAVVGSPQGEQAVPLEASDEPEYEVERLLAVRHVRGRKEYLCHWKGYGSWEDSWEPEENLANAQELLRAFWKNRGTRRL